jgi:hypothetical protein
MPKGPLVLHLKLEPKQPANHPALLLLQNISTLKTQA